jgi:RNA methyltransferase, TrmH family
MIRTAHALGADATLALPGTVDVWNAKVVRSAMGSLFRHHVQHIDVEEFRAFAGAHDVECWAADAAGESFRPLRTPARLALMVGNEGAGLSAEAGALASRRVALPMRGDAESLNVAVAAGILLYHVIT